VIYPNIKTKLNKIEPIEELTGKLSISDDKKLMHSVLENDKEKIDEGKLICDAINQGIDSFAPDLMFKDLINKFQMAKQIYGESLIRLITGYNPDYIKKNINIPEFQKELKERIFKKIEQLKDNKILNEDDSISDKGFELASLTLYLEELDNLAKGIEGEKIHKKSFIYGDKEDIKQYKKERYKDIAIRKSIKLAIRRSHKELIKDDLKVFQRKAKGKINLIYALDASGSMKGRKIELCKKAGIALAYNAINEKDNCGLIVFGTDVKEFISPCNDFKLLLKTITKIKASKQTNFVEVIRKSIELFPQDDSTRHLILLTDALPTIGLEPELDTLKAISIARFNGITTSLIGINLDKKGEELAQKITEIGQGRLYICRNIENLDKIVLEDYYSIL